MDVTCYLGVDSSIQLIVLIFSPDKAETKIKYFPLVFTLRDVKWSPWV